MEQQGHQILKKPPTTKSNSCCAISLANRGGISNVNLVQNIQSQRIPTKISIKEILINNQ